MREIRNKKFKNEKILLNLKKLGVIALFSTSSAVLLTSCGSKSESNEAGTTISSTASEDQLNSTTEAASTEKITVEPKTETASTEKITDEPKTEAKSEEKVVVSDALNIKDNASIEITVDKIYLEDKDFYDQNGISKDDIRNMIFVINDKYSDENNKPLMSEDEMGKAYDGINIVLFSDGFIQKMDNVNTTEYDVDKFELIDQPTIVDYIDLNLSGGVVLANEVAEYEELRDYEVAVMNKEGRIDIDAINKSVIKNEVTDINSNSNPMGSVKGNGQLYLMAATHVYRLNMAAIANNYDGIYLTAPEYDGIPTVKINYTVGERDVIGAVERLILDGLLPEETYNNVVTFIKKELEMNKTDKEIIQAVAAEYDLKMDYSNLILADVKARMSMASTSYLDTECDAFAKSKEAVASLNESYGLELRP